jgi:rod shape-determining protein MreD
MTLRRFFLASPIFLVIFLLQEGFVTQLRLPAGGFNLILIVALIWAALSTPEIGALTGFGAGIMMDLSQSAPGPLGHWTLVLIITCYAIAFLGYGDDNIRANPINILLLTVLGVVISQIIFLIFGVLLGQEIGSLGSVLYLLAGALFWSAITSPLILKVITSLHSNIFGMARSI